MPSFQLPALTRRGFLATGTAAAVSLVPAFRTFPARATPVAEFRLRAAPATVRLLPEPYPETAAWCFNGSVPGPEIRVRQGDRLRIAVENGLAEETTVHWHGLRLPNAMDGVPHVTQPPILPGGNFLYEFDAVDAGTFWYHPHQNSAEQVGRGLYGPLVIEERTPIRVDRDLTWVLDDWRLARTGQIVGNFGSMRDVAHNGRIGNVATINGREADLFAVRRGERIRLRLINAANARIFALDFAGHSPLVIALDGQPVTPHRPDGGLVVLGPAMRADVVLDMPAAAGSRHSVTDRFYRGQEYRLVDLAYADAPLRDGPPDWPVALPANPLPEPDSANAIRHDVLLNGGMMGGIVMQEMGGSMGGGAAGGMMNMMQSGRVWFINGVAADEHVPKPMLTLARGRTHMLALTNATAWHHPIHLHGHSFRVLSRDGKPTKHREWQDTVLMAPREKVEIAFVADNPGDWMFHCHILEHQTAGMMAVVRVT